MLHFLKCKRVTVSFRRVRHSEYQSVKLPRSTAIVSHDLSSCNSVTNSSSTGFRQDVFCHEILSTRQLLAILIHIYSVQQTQPAKGTVKVISFETYVFCSHLAFVFRRLLLQARDTKRLPTTRSKIRFFAPFRTVKKKTNIARYHSILYMALSKYYDFGPSNSPY